MVGKASERLESASTSDVIVGPEAVVTTSLNVEGHQVEPELGAWLEQMLRQLKLHVKSL